MDACRSLKAPATGAGLDVVAPSSPRPCAADIELARLGLAAQALRVALVTTHLPLREIADAITVERL